jgi:hypothetical protein
MRRASSALDALDATADRRRLRSGLLCGAHGDPIAESASGASASRSRAAAALPLGREPAVVSYVTRSVSASSMASIPPNPSNIAASC